MEMLLLTRLGGLTELFGFLLGAPLIPPAAAAAAVAGTIVAGMVLKGWKRQDRGGFESWARPKPLGAPREVPETGEYLRPTPYNLMIRVNSHAPSYTGSRCEGGGTWSGGGQNPTPQILGWENIYGHRWVSVDTEVNYFCSPTFDETRVEPIEFGLWTKDKSGVWSRRAGAWGHRKIFIGTFFKVRTMELHRYEPWKIDGQEIEWGREPYIPEWELPRVPLPKTSPDLPEQPSRDPMPEVLPGGVPEQPPDKRPAPPLTPDVPAGPETPSKPDVLPPWFPLPGGTPNPAPNPPNPPGSKPGGDPGIGTTPGTGDAPTIRPDGVVVPKPVPLPPTPAWGEDFWGEIIGQPEQRPAPTLVGIAQETGKLEQKLRIIGNPNRPGVGVPDGLLETLGNILQWLSTADPDGGYQLQAPCDRGPDGQLLPPVEVRWGATTGQLAAITKRLDALAELIQVHKDQKQPVCIGHAAVGTPVTVNFISADIPPGSRQRLRKVLSYRDQGGGPLEHHAEAWRSFRWSAGDVQVTLRGTDLGPVQVWASTEAEGRRVIEHAATAAGFTIPPDAEWIAAPVRSARVGQPGEMKVALDGGGALMVTMRSGSSGYPEVVT